jgi:hypothetical protein
VEDEEDTDGGDTAGEDGDFATGTITDLDSTFTATFAMIIIPIITETLLTTLTTTTIGIFVTRIVVDFRFTVEVTVDGFDLTIGIIFILFLARGGGGECAVQVCDCPCGKVAIFASGIAAVCVLLIFHIAVISNGLKRCVNKED